MPRGPMETHRPQVGQPHPQRIPLAAEPRPPMVIPSAAPPTSTSIPDFSRPPPGAMHQHQGQTKAGAPLVAVMDTVPPPPGVQGPPPRGVQGQPPRGVQGPPPHGVQGPPPNVPIQHPHPGIPRGPLLQGLNGPSGLNGPPRPMIPPGTELPRFPPQQRQSVPPQHQRGPPPGVPLAAPPHAPPVMGPPPQVPSLAPRAFLPGPAPEMHRISVMQSSLRPIPAAPSFGLPADASGTSKPPPVGPGGRPLTEEEFYLEKFKLK